MSNFISNIQISEHGDEPKRAWEPMPPSLPKDAFNQRIEGIMQSLLEHQARVEKNIATGQFKPLTEHEVKKIVLRVKDYFRLKP